MPQETADYAFRVTLDRPFEAALDDVTAGLKSQGFGVLTQIDVRATLKEKLGADFRRYAILGACNPPLAHRAFTAQLDAGLLLPCNVVVYERDDGASEVLILDPTAQMQIAGDERLDPVASEAREKLMAVAEGLKAG